MSVAPTLRDRSQIAWERALEYAEHKAECMYPDKEMQFRVKWRMAYAEYDKLMYGIYRDWRKG